MRNVILGTDWSSDCDDVVALRILCRAHKTQTINLLGVNIDDNIPLSVRSLSAFLCSENCDDIPIGFDFSAKRVCKFPKYQDRLSRLPSILQRNEQAEDSVSFYRRLLAQTEGKVEIMEIGYLQSLAALLRSKPGRFSPMPGLELVRQKVEKFWIMGGKWDQKGGLEHNFTGTRATKKAIAYICKHCPVPITFLGWEIAAGVCVGGDLPEGDVLRDAIIDYGCDPSVGRDAWDPMLVCLALFGEEKAGYRAVGGTARVSPLTGKNYFTPGQGLHSFVRKLHPDAFYIDFINALIR